MSVCLRMVIKANSHDENLIKSIQKEASRLGVEGQVQVTSGDELKVVACCGEDELDAFVDYLYEAFPSDIEVEHFMKQRDYRGAFRVIS